MPAQEPVASIISMSNSVRCSSRCASNSLPVAYSSSSRCFSSPLIEPTACCSVGFGVT
jgi:hypothetical protein